MRASVERVMVMASGLARFACIPWIRRYNICSLGVYDGPPRDMEFVCLGGFSYAIWINIYGRRLEC